MMKTAEMQIKRQAQVNYERYIDVPKDGLKYVGRLLTCNAEVYVNDGVYYLKSYKTFVAAVDTNKALCIDYLRAVYKYTHTSAQHISKFFDVYAPWNKNYKCIIRIE